jgi:peptidoglycan/LPS O-acetylase OafA/YrhL
MTNKPFQIDALWRHAPTLDEALASPANLFTPIRMILALGVLLGHSYVVNLGEGIPEPLSMFDMTISYVAVNGFFILSGLLITRSIDRNPDLIRYFSARALRLYPAMVVCVLLASFVFGPLVSALPPAEYYTNPQLWKYICDVLTFGDTAGGPPQIFPGNPFEGEWAASLWTLRFEALAYAGTAVLAFLGLSRSRTLMLALFVTSVSLFFFVRMDVVPVPEQLLDLTRFATTYMLGAVLYCYRDQVRLSWSLGLGITAIAICFGPFASFEIMLNFLLAAWVLLIGFAKIPGRVHLSRMPDFSYGVYIWQWPVMQALWYFDIARDPAMTMLLAIPGSILMGAISWYTLEKPVLALKDPLASWLHQKIKVRRTA